MRLTALTYLKLKGVWNSHADMALKYEIDDEVEGFFSRQA